MERNAFNNIEQLENGTPADRIIVIKSVFKTGKTTVQPVTDGTGWYLGVERLSEEDKRKRTHWAEPSSKYVLRDGVTFDLNDDAQRITWAWVKHSPCIALNEDDCQHTPGAEFYVYLENEVAAKNISRRELKYKVIECILNDNSVNYPMRAELLGVNMDYARPSVIKDFLLDQAELTPEKVLAIYEGADVSVRLLLIKAKKMNLVKVDEAGFYRYGNVVLGMSEKAAVDWLQEKSHRHLIDMIEREANPEYFEKSEPKEDVQHPTPKEDSYQAPTQDPGPDVNQTTTKKPIITRGGAKK